MLQTLRTRAAGTVAKVLFSILVLSFAVWGVGDYAFLRRSEPTAINVAGVKVTATELGNEYRRDLDNLRRSLGDVDPETARQFGLMDRVVERIVSKELFANAADHLGLRIGDDLVRMRLLRDPSLVGPGGTFDRQRFLEVLQQAGYTEDRFVALVRADIARALITEPFTAGIEVPEPVVDRLYRYRNERRTAETVFVASDSFTDVGAPSAEELKTLYEDDPERYTAPEYRALSMVRVGVEEMIPTIQVSEEELRDAYSARIESLRVAEKREVDQILFSDEAAAKSAAEKIAAGADFVQVATEDAKQTAETTHLGLIDRTALLPELASAVFALEENKPSEPVKSPFGWHLFRVTKIEAGREPSFDEVKPQLQEELARQEAGAAAVKASNKLEDALAEGTSLEDAAKQIGVAVTTVDAVDQQGRGLDGLLVSTLSSVPEVIMAGFDQEEGRTSPILETRAGAFYVVRADKVTPSRLKPLEEVRNEIESQWRTRKRDEAAKAQADKVLADAKAGQTLEALAGALSLKHETTPPLRRTIDTALPAGMTPDLVGQMFRLNKDELGVASGTGGYFVLRVTEIAAADPATDAAGVDRVRVELRQRMAGDLGTSLTDALKQRLGVSVDEDVVKTVQ